MRTSKPITVTLGKQQAILEEQLASGEFESASEVVRAGLMALEREKQARTEYYRRLVEEALNDPRPDVSLEDAFERLRLHHEKRVRERG